MASNVDDAPGALHSLDQDPFLRQFAEGAVDVGRFAAGQMDSIEPSLAKLQNGMALVNRRIRQEVTLHEGALLEQAAHIAMLEDALRTAKEGVARIESATTSVADAIRGPIEALTVGTLELEKLQLVCEVLRRTLRFVSLYRKMEKHMEQGVQHYPQAARCLAELAVMEQPDSMLRGVDVVEQLVPGLEAKQSALRSKASSLLMEGLQAQSQQDVCTALLVFSAFGALRDKVRTAVSITTNRVRRAIDSGIGSCGADAGAQCWAALDGTLAELHGHCLALLHLQGCLLRTKDPATGGTLWETLCNSRDEGSAEQVAEHAQWVSLVEPFWIQLAAKLSSAVAAAQRQPLHKNYPKLLTVLRDFVRRVVSSYEMMQLPLTGGHRLAEEAALLHVTRALAPIEGLHLDRVRQRLRKAADGLWPKLEEDKVSALCRVMLREMSDARGAGDLGLGVAALVVESTKWIAHECVGRAEKHLATVATLTQPNQTNAALANALLLIESCLQSLLLTDRNDAFQQAIDACAASLRTLYSYVSAALKAQPASLDAFKQAVLPLYNPSPLLHESLRAAEQLL